jgi:hypothetical protein
MSIFFEPQSGGLCRLHSINGYFGSSKITQSEFQIYVNDYDLEYKTKYNLDISCELFDVVSSDQTNIVNYILKRHGIYSRYYALNQIYGKSIQQNIIEILRGEYFFIYNESHIWGCRIYNNQWYKVDSIGGVSSININSLQHTKNIGFIVPVDIKNEFYRNLKIIKNIFNDDVNSIEEYLITQNNEKKILGDLEIPLNLCMDILQTNLLSKYSKINLCDFHPIQEQVDMYNTFLSQFTKGNYNNNIDISLKYLPCIVKTLINLKCIN